ncbi:hypothetical protein D9M71_483380 [compost metagenome]
MLMDPQCTGPRIERRALRVAVPVGPDFRPCAGLADEGIVPGNTPVRLQAHHLALQLVELLRGGPLTVLAEGDEQVAGAIEHQSRTEMDTAGQLGLLAEDHLEPLQAVHLAGQPAAADCTTGPAIHPLLGIAQVDQTIFGKAWRQGDIQQATLPPGKHLRHAGQWRGHYALGRHPAQTPGTLGDQHALTARQKSQGPGMLQSAGDFLQLQRVMRTAWSGRGLGCAQQAGDQQSATAAHQDRRSLHRASPWPASAGAASASCSPRNSASTRALLNCSSWAAYSRVSVPRPARSSSGCQSAGWAASSAR